MYSPNGANIMVQEVGGLMGWRRRELKAEKSCSQGHFLFTCSDTFAVVCIV